MNLLISFRFLKFMGKCYGVWPLEDDEKNIWTSFYACLWWFYFTNVIIAAVTTILTCYHARYDFLIASFSWMEFIAYMEILIILINNKCYHSLLKNLVIQSEEYLVTADKEKQTVLQEKAMIFGMIMIMIVFLYLVIVILYYTNPAVTTWDNFLTTTYYPPWIRSTLVDIFIYFNQIVVMIHSSAMVNVDAVVVLLIYICSTRLKILASQMQALEDQPAKLKECIQEHQCILSLAEDTIRAVRAVISKTIVAFVIYSVGAGLQITNPKATVASMRRFGVVFLINCLRLIMHGTSANYLITVSNDIALSAYSTLWYKETRDVIMTKIIMMIRSQKILKIHVPGIMPMMDLPFITGIIATSISYFTTLRAITTAS